jgi:hypothetical protein
MKDVLIVGLGTSQIALGLKEIAVIVQALDGIVIFCKIESIGKSSMQAC